MTGIAVALEILKYVIPLLVTAVLGLAVGHFNQVRRQLDEAKDEQRRLAAQQHELELAQTRDRANVEVQIRAAVAEVVERIASKYVPMASYLSSQAGVEKRLDTMDLKMDRVEAKLDKMVEGRA